MKKKIYVFAAFMLCVLMLAGCGGGDGKDKDGDSKNPAETRKPENELLYYDAKGSWEEQLDALGENGASLKVSIDAEIGSPSAKAAFVTEVVEFCTTEEYKEEVLSQIFGVDDVYLYDMEHIPAEQLNAYISELSDKEQSLLEEIESTYDEDIKQRRRQSLDEVRAQLENYREYLETAPTEFIPADTLEGDAFAGLWNGVMYAVYFQNYFNENPPRHRAGIFTMVKPSEGSYPVRNMSIVVEPVNMAEVAPESMAKADGISINDMFYYDTVPNQTARELADRFVLNMGINAAELNYMNTLPSSSSPPAGGAGGLVWTADGADSVNEGYFFNYSVAIDPDGEVFAYDSDLVFNQMAQTVEIKEPQYSRKCTVTVYVMGERIIYAEINNPVEVVSINEHVKVLPFDTIKDVIRSELSENIQKYTLNDTSDGGVIRFSDMWFGYVRVRDKERKDFYSYIPAWRLLGSNVSSLNWGAENMIIINAIDGTPVSFEDIV